MTKAKKVSKSTIEKAVKLAESTETAVEVVEPTKTVNVVDTEDLVEKVSDVEVYGNPDTFVLVSKASSKSEQWMKSTKACNTATGVLIQVTTQQGGHVAEAMQFVPGEMYSQKLKKFRLL